ncbi:FxLYD domain-containing protein [Streptomyces rubiginosohelvolus]|uniref:FxLYD domain-containing protein n=1 Tax=Streptomyces rubiginosohelvolus TaxID=67362 RepID=UPI0033EDE7E1
MSLSAAARLPTPSRLACQGRDRDLLFLVGVFTMSQHIPPPDQQAPPKKSGLGKKLGFGCLGVVGLFTVFGLAAGLGGGNDDTADNAPAPAVTVASSEKAGVAAQKPAGPEGDVKVTGCEVDSTPTWARADLTITNRSSKKSNYLISIEFVDKTGTRIGEAVAATSNLAPGQSAQGKAQGLDQITGAITCKITDVTRYAS